jgi:hypothetical protein
METALGVDVIQWWPLIVAVFGAGLGWGVHQVTLTQLSKAVVKLELKVERMDSEMSHLTDAIARIETKLDMLMRSCPALGMGNRGQGQSSCGD